jgi:DNA-binding transcriptional LysR family regulator
MSRGSNAMDASDLRIFESVARLGGMNRAASELNTVQSNVTARIRTLEQELGIALFRRTSRGTSLTPAGERLLPFAKKVERLLRDAALAARDEGEPRGPLVIGSLETTAALRLTPLLSRFTQSFPEVDLSLKTGTTCELVEEVLGGHVEGAFVCGPVDHAELEQESIYREELVLLTARRFGTLGAYLAANDPRIVVLRAGCSYRLILEAWLARRGIVGARLLEFGTLEAIIGCVEAGLGMTLLPRSLIEAIWRGREIAVHSLSGKEAHVDTVFICRSGSRRSSALDAFLAMARPGLARLQAAE